MRLEVSHRPDKDARIISVNGACDGEAGPSLASALTEAVEDGCSVVVVDLCATTLIDAGGVAALLGAAKQVQAAGVQLRIACDGGTLVRNFRVYGLDRVIPHFRGIDEALEA